MKKIIIKLLLFLLITVVFTFIFTDNKKIYVVEQKSESKLTDFAEKDKNIIKEYLAEGMSSSDYLDLFNNKSIKVNESGKYVSLNYDFEKKLHYSEIEDYLKKLSKSNIVNLFIIGKSVDNRNIYNIEIGNGDKVLLLDSNIHSAEVANTYILMKFLIDLVNDYTSGNENALSLLNNVKIAAIPCINPDGYEVFNYGIESINNKDLWIYQNKDNVNVNNFKYNANGIDLNRNFPTQNGGLYYKEYNLLKSVSLDKTTQSGTYFSGKVLGSEPETRAVMYQILTHYKNAYAYIDLHNQGRVIYSGKPNLSNEYNESTIKLCNIIGDITGYHVYGLEREEVGEGNDGTVSDFMAELVNDFMFSTKTGRLSSSNYKNNNAVLKYNVPAIVVETTKDYSKDPSYYKEEYYNHGIKEMLYKLLEYGINT